MKTLWLLLLSVPLSAQIINPTGGGTVGPGTIGYLPKFGTTTTIGNSGCDDGITSANILTCAESGGIAAAGFTGTGSTAGYMALINGSSNSIPANSVRHQAPVTVSTGFGMTDPSAEPAAISFQIWSAAASHETTATFVSAVPAALTDGATVTWAIGSNPVATATLLFTAHGGSRTLNITGPVSGATYILKVTQDGTGSEGLTLGTGCTWKVISGGSGAVTLSTAANSVDVLTFWYDGTNCNANLGKNYN